MELNIEINCEDDVWQGFLDEAQMILHDVTVRVLEEVGLSNIVNYTEVSVLLTNNRNMRNINRDFRGKDKPTNVLSFPSEEFEAGDYENVEGNLLLGDLAFANEIITSEAKEQGKSLKDHFTHLVLHGVLHLLGYNHIEDSDAEQMESIEINILDEMGISSPY